MDEIRIYGLDIFAHHGVFAAETQLGQHFFVNLVLYTETRQAGLTDTLDNTTNYGEVCHAVTQFLQEHTYQLIEAAAEQTARMILTSFPYVHGVDLELQKPQAPIGLPFETVSVKLHRQWNRAFVALGSNMGDSRALIQTALEGLAEHPLIRLKKVASLIVTKPYGGVEQDDFLNSAAELETLLTPQELLEELHRLEQNANRVREIHWGPRTLDLDILLYEGVTMYTDTLIIPHIDMQNRDFVLQPMAELAPYEEHPILHKSMLQLWQEWQEKHT